MPIPLDGLMEPDRGKWIYADFNGLLARDLLCIAHSDTVKDRAGRVIHLREGMRLTAYDEDEDDERNPDALFATGVVEPSPKSKHSGTRWSLRTDEDGVRHESEIGVRRFPPVGGGADVMHVAQQHRSRRASLRSAVLAATGLLAAACLRPVGIRRAEDNRSMGEVHGEYYVRRRHPDRVLA